MQPPRSAVTMDSSTICSPRPSCITRPLRRACRCRRAPLRFRLGVLDRLLEDECIDFDGISATSVGAVNATVLAYGLAVGGRAGARHALADIWRRVATLASLSPLQPTPFDRLTGNQSLETSPAFVQFDIMTRLFSPYQLNPFNINPLRSILCDTVDFDAIRNARCPIKLFLSATNVRSGKIRVFHNDEIGPDAVLASACLPFLFKTEFSGIGGLRTHISFVSDHPPPALLW